MPSYKIDFIIQNPILLDCKSIAVVGERTVELNSGESTLTTGAPIRRISEFHPDGEKSYYTAVYTMPGMKD